MVVRLAIGADHAGQDLAKHMQSLCQTWQWSCVTEPMSDQKIDYPDRIPFVVQHVYQGYVGLLICGTGIGMSIVANRYPGIGAALCTDPEMAKMARLHNNANILILPGRLMSFEMAERCLSIFLQTPFEGGRHHRRTALFDPILADTPVPTILTTGECASPLPGAPLGCRPKPPSGPLLPSPCAQLVAPFPSLTAFSES